MKRCVAAGTAAESSAPPVGTITRFEVELLVREGLADVAAKMMPQPGARDAQGPLLAEISAARRWRATASLVASGSAAPLLRALDDEEVGFAVIKGPATGRFYPAQWQRSYSDIDIIVAPRDFRRTTALAERLGWAIPLEASAPWRAFNRYCREGINLHRGLLGNVDVHHHVPPWAFGKRLRAQDIIRRSERSLSDGLGALFAAREDLVVIASLHILNDIWKRQLSLQSIRDILVLTAGDLGAFETKFDCLHLGWLFDLTADLLRELFPEAQLGLPDSGRERQNDARRAARLALMGWSSDSWIARSDLAWAARLPTPHALYFLCGSAMPSLRYIRDRDGAYPAYWRRTWGEMSSLRTPGPKEASPPQQRRDLPSKGKRPGSRVRARKKMQR